jgi:hypothetical protein
MRAPPDIPKNRRSRRGSYFRAAQYKNALVSVARSTNIAWSHNVDEIFGTHRTVTSTGWDVTGAQVRRFADWAAASAAASG